MDDEQLRFRSVAAKLRAQCTNAEKLLWECLQNSGTGFKFSRQIRVAGFYVDFACRQRRLAIELDGESHEVRQEMDIERENRIRSAGYEVVRFSNDELF